MGCGGYPGELSETDAIEIRRDNCNLTRLLCLACERLSDRIYQGDEELATWYEKHQEEDRKRVALEIRQAADDKILRRAELERLVAKYPRMETFKKELRDMDDG